MIDAFLEGCLVGFFAGLFAMMLTAGGSSIAYGGSAGGFDAWCDMLQRQEDDWQNFRMISWAVCIVGTGIFFAVV